MRMQLLGWGLHHHGDVEVRSGVLLLSFLDVFGRIRN